MGISNATVVRRANTFAAEEIVSFAHSQDIPWENIMEYFEAMWPWNNETARIIATAFGSCGYKDSAEEIADYIHLALICE